MRSKLRILSLFILISIGFIGLIFVSRGASIEKILMGRVEIPIYLLTVTGSGAGSGTIIGSVSGINCTSTAGVESGICSAYIPSGTTIILTATPDIGSLFSGWTGSGCSGTGTCTITMDGDKTVDAEFSKGLIAWYKFDEGGGSVVVNYAVGLGALPDLTVLNWDGTFWTYLPGFASSPSFGGSNCARAILSVPIDFGPNQGWGIFYQWNVESGNYYYGLLHGDLANTHSWDGWGSLFHRATQKTYRFWNLVSETPLTTLALNEWGFLFQNETMAYLVKSDGTLASAIISTPSAEVFKYLIVGAIQTQLGDTAGAYGASGSYADLIIYNGVSPDLSVWGDWYDLLRSRYGMAPRSGW